MMHIHENIIIAFAYDLPAASDGVILDTVGAEYEDEPTIEWIRDALGRVGKVIDLPWCDSFVTDLDSSKADIVFNITEASGTRNRESLVPSIAEALGIPCTGSDAVSLGISLDKMLTKELAASWGVQTPKSILLSRTRVDTDPAEAVLTPPVIVKPNTGGSSLGIHEGSRFSDIGPAMEFAVQLAESGGDDVLIEEFIAGREIAVALLEEANGLTVFPHAELVIGEGTPDEFYTSERKQHHEKTIICPAELSSSVSESIAVWSSRLFNRLGCADFARIDFRLDEEGVPFLLEMNPLPGLSPFYGIYQTQAQAYGLTAEDVVVSILENTFRRTASTP